MSNKLKELNNEVICYIKIVVVSILLIGCEGKEKLSNDSNYDSDGSGEVRAARNSKPSCFVDKGFYNDIDCYEGEATLMKKRCDDIGSRAEKEATIHYSNSGCPTDRKYIGCCAYTEETQCYYLSDLYDTKAKADESKNDAKSNCIEAQGQWEE